jgi:hypothetical protein
MDRGSQMKGFDLRISQKEWDKYKSIDLAICNFFYGYMVKTSLYAYMYPFAIIVKLKLIVVQCTVYHYISLGFEPPNKLDTLLKLPFQFSYSFFYFLKSQT